MERRLHLVASLDSHGILRIEGSPGDDVVTVVALGPTLLVTDNGLATPFAAAGVVQIRVAGHAGNDSITLLEQVPASEVDGGIGNDTIRTGNGDDTITGGTGVDQLAGGVGDDRFFTRDGAADTVEGGLGRDTAKWDSQDIMTGTEVSNPYAPAADNQPLTVKVLALNFDLPVASEGGRLLHDVFKWNDPVSLARQYEADLEKASGGFVNFEVEWKQMTAFPPQVDGRVWTTPEYVDRVRSGLGFAQVEADYPRFLREQGIDRRVAAGEVDEVWGMGAPFVALNWEAAMAGPRSFFTNGSAYTTVDSGRPFAIMGFNFERGVGEMLHSNGHRIEGTLNRFMGTWNLANPTSDWDKFSANVNQSGGKAGIGTVHWPANAQADYDYGNPRVVQSWAHQFLDYPAIGATTLPVSRDTWGRGSNPDYQRDYLNWYAAHLPRVGGTSASARQNNWWKYVYDYDSYAPNGQARPPTAALEPLAAANPTGNGYHFAVTYTGAKAIDFSSIDGSDVRVTGPNGFNQLATLVRVEQGSQGRYARATYRIAAPGGSWDVAEYGTYGLTLQANQVRATDGTAVAAGALGSAVIVRSSVIPVNQLVGSGQATVTGTVPDIGSFATLLDGDPATLYRSPAVNPAVVQVALLTPRTFTEFRIRFAGPQGAAQNRWMVETADTQADMTNKTGTYRIAVPFTNQPSGGYSVVTLATPIPAKIARLTAQRMVGDNYVHVWDWQLVGETPVSTLAITAPASAVQVGRRLQYRATVLDGDGQPIDVTDRVDWSTAGATVATIDSLGLASGIATGATSILASYGTMSASLPLDVVAAVADAAPTATLVPPQTRAREDGTYHLQVRYTDVGGSIDASTIGSGDLLVTGPGGFSQLASFVSLDDGFEPASRVALYAIAAPGATWDLTDNGRYTVSMRTSQVGDTGGNVVAAGVVGSVRIALSTAPKIDVRALVTAGQALVTASPFDIGSPINLFDDDLNSLYRSAAVNPAFVQVAFATPRSFAGFAATFGGGAGAYRWKIEIADTQADLDGRTGTYVEAFGFTDQPEGGSAQARLATATIGRVVRLWAHRTQGDNYVHIFDWTLLGSADVVPVTAALGAFDVGDASLTASFAEDVTASLTATDLVVTNVTTGARFAPLAWTYDAATRTARYTFGASLPDGTYVASIDADSVTDAAGNPLAASLGAQFFVLAGDANRDRKVDFDDLLILAQHYGQSGRTYQQGNFNYSPDGKVDFDDLLILAQRYGQSLSPAALAATTATPAPAKRRRPGASDML